MVKANIANRVTDLHKGLYHELNDIHIFASRTIPLLNETAKDYRAMRGSENRVFLIPRRTGEKGITQRTPEEVAALFEKFAQRELQANLLLVCVSRFESFLNDVLRVFLAEYPEKLSAGIKGGESTKQIPISLIVNSSTLAEAQSAVAESRLQSVFYAEPKEYLAYFENITGVAITEDLFLSFIETKATRDLIIHNSGKVNDLYVRKTGKRARAKVGAVVPLDKRYFASCISVMKAISTEIAKKVRAA